MDVVDGHKVNSIVWYYVACFLWVLSNYQIIFVLFTIFLAVLFLYKSTQWYDEWIYLLCCQLLWTSQTLHLGDRGIFLTMATTLATTYRQDLRILSRYRIAGNFCEHKFLQITNKHARKKISWFYFRNKVTISDHTPYNFSHANGDLHHEFQHQNDSKTLARLSKCVGRCRQRTAMPKGGS